MSSDIFALSRILRIGFGCIAALVSVLSGPVPTFAADRAPDWLKAAQQIPATASRKEDSAVVLLQETLVDVSVKGSFSTRERFVVRVLTPEGKEHALARVSYDVDSSKVKSFQAWLIASDGKVTEFGKRRIIDAAVHMNAMELYGQSRQQLIDATDETKPGAVFGYEAVVEETSILSQRIVRFQSDLPVERTAYTVQIPAGWKIDAHSFNQAPAFTEGVGGRYTWTSNATPALVLEPLAPPALAFVPWVAIDIVPPTTVKPTTSRVAFGTWAEISTYFSPRYDAMAVADAPMKAKADELVRGKTDLFVKLQALAGYVQEVNYISIQLDAANAGGMIPRAASRVFRTNYGDCKDKANLLRALLATQGITSFPFVVQSGEGTRIRDEWPSPLQFNHAILAIQVDASVDSPAVFNHPELGRLLVFDPTNEFTPIGALVDTMLADKGILLAGAHGGLVTLPAEKSESNRMERRVKATLDELGGITGTIEEEFFGQASAGVRSERRKNGDVEFRRKIERWLGGTLPAAQNTRAETKDFWNENRFTMTTDFSSAKYGKLMRDELLVFKPALVARRGAVALRKGTRKQPVLLRPYSYSEQTEIVLPASCVVEETIRPTALTTPFGSYRATCTTQDGKLIFERSLDLKAAELPVSDFEAVRAFFEKIVQTEQSPVVLKRVQLASSAP